MAAPTTATLDNFTRANGAIGSNWTQLVQPDEGLPTISSNQAVTTGGGGVSSGYWNVTQFGGDMETWWIGNTLSTENDCWTRIGSPQVASDFAPFAGYDLNWDGSSNLILLKANGSGSVTQVGSTVTGVSGVLGLWLQHTIAGQLTGYIWNGSTWTSTITATDTTFQGAGYCGFEFGSGVPADAMTSFGGGTLNNTIQLLENEDGGHLILLENGQPVRLEQSL